MYQFVTYEDADGIRAGVLADSRVYELKGAPAGESGLVRWIENPEGGISALEESMAGPFKPVDAVKLCAPLRYPGKILAAGANYRSHAAEMRSGASAPSPETAPYLFMKPTRHCVIGPGETIWVPPWAEQIDWEVELAVVIGRPAYRVSPEDAMQYVFGYTILVDITSRRQNHRTDGRFPHDWFSGKGLQSFGPMGPAVTPKAFFPDPPDVHLSLRVNGETMQDGNSDQLIFDIPALIAYASERITLDPGDVISTGTPSGVGAGRGLFLKPGDRIEAEVEGVGILSNPVALR